MTFLRNSVIIRLPHPILYLLIARSILFGRVMLFLLYFHIRFEYKKPCTDEDDPHDVVRNKLKRYNLLLSYCNPGGASYEKIKQEKEGCLKSLHLEEDKIFNNRRL